jgi:hypothetical protein
MYMNKDQTTKYLALAFMCDENNLRRISVNYDQDSAKLLTSYRASS